MKSNLVAPLGSPYFIGLNFPKYPLFAEEIEQTASKSPPPLRHWFYLRTKYHTTIHCIGVYNIMLSTDGCAVLNERTERAVPK